MFTQQCTSRCSRVAFSAAPPRLDVIVTAFVDNIDERLVVRLVCMPVAIHCLLHAVLARLRFLVSIGLGIWAAGPRHSRVLRPQERIGAQGIFAGMLLETLSACSSGGSRKGCSAAKH